MKRDKIFLKHIIENISLIEKSLQGIRKEDFFKDRDKQDANLRRLEIIGEAVKNISKELKTNYSSIPWRSIAGTRDKLIHEYFGVDLEITWSIIKKDLPLLKKEIEKILKKLEKEEDKK